jgi:hypothetical protein
MAPSKTKFKKDAKPVYMEPALREFARKKSLERGCLHDKVGSASEYVRRGFKTWILKEMPYLKNSMKNVDWNEIY